MAATTKERVQPPADSAALETSKDQRLNGDLGTIAQALPAFQELVKAHQDRVPGRTYDVPNADDLTDVIGIFHQQLEAWRRNNAASAPAVDSPLDNAKGLEENGDALRTVIFRAGVTTKDPDLQETLRSAADLVGLATYRSAERGQAPTSGTTATKRPPAARHMAPAKPKTSVRR